MSFLLYYYTLKCMYSILQNQIFLIYRRWCSYTECILGIIVFVRIEFTKCFVESKNVIACLIVSLQFPVTKINFYNMTQKLTYIHQNVFFAALGINSFPNAFVNFVIFALYSLIQLLLDDLQEKASQTDNSHEVVFTKIAIEYSVIAFSGTVDFTMCHTIQQYSVK